RQIFNIVTIIFIMVLYSCSNENNNHSFALELIDKIETYRELNGCLPNTVSDIGFTENLDSFAFYAKESDTEYIVWYGLSLGALW
ncbi:MAG: hypothetical protein GY756_03585, partial [bacterium]|nr:hypothetical protein [bacterium]